MSDPKKDLGFDPLAWMQDEHAPAGAADESPAPPQPGVEVVQPEPPSPAEPVEGSTPAPAPHADELAAEGKSTNSKNERKDMSTVNTDSIATQNPAMDSPTLAEGGLQFLTFTVGVEHYGVDILRVQEIKGWSPVTRIPNTPEHLRGVLNMRGVIVPVVDLRMRFNLPNADYTATTVVIVLCVKSEDGNERTLGIVVDGVSDVLDVARDEVKQTPDFGSRVSTEFISGLVTVNDNMVMLLDIDKLLDVSDLHVLDEARAAADSRQA